MVRSARRQHIGVAVWGTAGAAVLWGTLGPVASLFPSADGLTFSFVRVLIGAVALSLIALRARRTRWTWSDGGAALAGGIGVAAYTPMYFGAIQLTGVAAATFLSIGAAPVVTGLLRWCLPHGRPPTLRWWAQAASRWPASR